MDVCRLYTGGVNVSANDPESESGFLTCLNGPPLDGLRCKKGAKDGIDLSNGVEMVVVAQLLADDAVSPIAVGIDGIRILPPGGRV